MNRGLKATAGGLASLVVAGGLVTLGAVAAHATTVPPAYEPDPNAVGTITFYDQSGNVVTSGTTAQNPFTYYAVGSAVIRAGDTTAVLQAAQPDPSKTPANFFADQMTGFQHYPVTTAGAPANIKAQTTPVASANSSDLSLQNFIDEAPTSDPSYGVDQNLYQIRLKTANPAGAQTAQYDVADVQVDPTTNTWKQVYPAVKTATTTTLTATPSPSTVGQSVTLNASETPAVAGSVQFKDGGTNIGSPVAVDGTGKASTSTSSLTQGSHSLSAVFTPTDTTNYTGSTGTSTEVVNPASTPTTTTLAVNQDGIAGDDATLTSTVKAGSTALDSTAGSVAFFDNGTTNLGSGTYANGVWTLDVPTGFAAGSHSVTAVFTPTNPATYQTSTSAPQAFNTNPKPASGSACSQTGSSCTDTQYIQATVPIGTLSISTPYTAGAPLDLGNLTLDPTGSVLTGKAAFQNIKVVDNRGGDLPWTAQALATALSSTTTATGNTSINAQNVGLTSLIAGNGSNTAGVTTYDNAAANGVQPADTGSLGLGGTSPHTVAKTATGLGTEVLNGVLTINAPTNTANGLYLGTITFTVLEQ